MGWFVVVVVVVVVVVAEVAMVKTKNRNKKQMESMTILDHRGPSTSSGFRFFFCFREGG
jgi:hypothetical protein